MYVCTTTGTYNNRDEHTLYVALMTSKLTSSFLSNVNFFNEISRSRLPIRILETYHLSVNTQPPNSYYSYLKCLNEQVPTQFWRKDA